MRRVNLPLTQEDISLLRVGDELLLSGIVYTARDQAHFRIENELRNGVSHAWLKGAIIYYTGPSPSTSTRNGSFGPTSSYRMDGFVETMMVNGSLVSLGKGPRSLEAKELCVKYKAVYLTTVGGAGAYISTCVKKSKLLLFPELESEAVYELEVEDLYCVVTYDSVGGDIYELSIKES